MARIRTIKPKFWDDAKIGKISRDARLLYVGMWTFCDDAGTIIADPIWLKSKIFPYDQIQLQQFNKFCKELLINGFISLFSYKEEEFYYLPNFSRHQVINRPNFEELNVPKEFIYNELQKNTEQSVNNHGTISAGIGEDKEKDNKKEILSNESIKKKAASAATHERKEAFYHSLIPYADKYGKEMLRAFFDYWSEMNASQTKMRFEKQPTWELSKRLATWENNEKKYEKNTGKILLKSAGTEAAILVGRNVTSHVLGHMGADVITTTVTTRLAAAGATVVNVMNTGWIPCH